MGQKPTDRRTHNAPPSVRVCVNSKLAAARKRETRRSWPLRGAEAAGRHEAGGCGNGEASAPEGHKTQSAKPAAIPAELALRSLKRARRILQREERGRDALPISIPFPPSPDFALSAISVPVAAAGIFLPYPE